VLQALSTAKPVSQMCRDSMVVAVSGQTSGHFALVLMCSITAEEPAMSEKEEIIPKRVQLHQCDQQK